MTLLLALAAAAASPDSLEHLRATQLQAECVSTADADACWERDVSFGRLREKGWCYESDQWTACHAPSKRSDSAIWTLLAVVALYLLPGLIADRRKHHQRLAIGGANLFFGWIPLVWPVLLIWSLTAVKKESINA